jgi:hypothetical protein
VEGSGKARGVVFAVAALLALVALASGASARERQAPKPNQSSNAEVGGGPVELNGGFSPKGLPPVRRVPISWSTEAHFTTPDGSHLPALTELQVALDRSIALHTDGLPHCRRTIDQWKYESISERCKGSLVGRGQEEVEILFEESNEVTVQSPVRVYFAGRKGAVSEFAISAYITFPVPASVDGTMKIERAEGGRYGLLASIRFPKIVGGAGSISSLGFDLHRVYTSGGRRHSLLSARCWDGRLQGYAHATFSDGSAKEQELLRTCTPVPEPKLPR